MFGIESLSGPAYAGVMVSTVFLEAIFLYVGYGGLMRIVGPSVKTAIQGE